VTETIGPDQIDTFPTRDSQVSSMTLPFRQSVSESDIDWIICVELNGNPLFRSWLGEKVFREDFKPEFSHVGAWRSVVDSLLGESDIVWLVTAPSGERWMALIENKIDAPAQELQAERYFRRGDKYCAEQHCTAYRVVLVSPQDYTSADSSQYGTPVSYESIRDFFGGGLGERAQYLSSLFTDAVANPKPPPDPAISEFRRQVFQLAQSDFKHLGLQEPKPTREYWVAQSYGNVVVKYKMYATHGVFHSAVVDLEFPGRAAEIEALRVKYAANLPKGATIVLAGRSAAVRIAVPCARPPAFDHAVTHSALQAWASLLTWWKAQSV
jgi:hypothetical protein